MVDAALWLTGTALLVMVALTYASIRFLSDVLGEAAGEQEHATSEGDTGTEPRQSA
ncbi:hypothetical protein [Halorientalis litorea]|jgi:hypothetical protein|uniref:hypothetical protein n=1 Tax=Halorientalis litorea TaxID=2931977 RepID=UPI001FF40A8F|nr:hypothetical protein [Halorientalis litorea]